jgi:hypothetical protein
MVRAQIGSSATRQLVHVLEEAVAGNPELTEKHVNPVYWTMQWMKSRSTHEVHDSLGPRYMSGLDPAQAKREIDC